VAEKETCKQAVLKVRCAITFVTIRSACTQLQHDQVECIQRIATLVYNLTTYQREYTIAQLQQQAVVMQKEQLQKSQVDIKHCLEEAEVLSNIY